MTEECSERNPVEVLAEEYISRRRNGEHPTVNEYAERFPEWEAEIRDVFPTLLMIENLKPTAEDLDPPHEALPVDQLGDYRILREIGRGGMGVVYEALQESLDRRVALKVLYGRSLNKPHRLRRFEREAQTAAKLHHTNIVPVFGVGEQDGMYYYVMQLISGQGLDRILAALRQDPTPIPSTQSFATSRNESTQSNSGDSHSLSPLRLAHTLVSGQSEALSATLRASESHIQSNEIAVAAESQDADAMDLGAAADQPIHLLNVHGPTPSELDNVYWQNVVNIGIQVAEALSYAHEQDVLHRDIKPANLLLNDQGTVWITDFGLAKLLEEDSLTNSGDIVGTLSYMAPEQFDGLSDHRSDIYSLGLTLYELITLQPAFDDSDRRRLIKQVTQNTPVLPRKLNPTIPIDLETVVLKAICREPEGRYQTALDLALDLRRIQEDRPILARRISLAERTRRWCRRNPAMASLASLTLLLLVLLCTLTTVGFVQIRQAYHNTNAALERESFEHRQAEAERERAEDNIDVALTVLEEVFRQAAPSRFEQGINTTLDAVEPIAEFDPVVTSDNAALLQNFLPLYDRLAQQNSSTPEVQLRAGMAHRRLGDIQRRLGQFQVAETAYRRAITVFEKLAVTNPTEAQYDRQTAQAFNDLGELMQQTRRFAAAVTAHQNALAIYKKRLNSEHPTADDRLQLVLTLHHLGRSLARDRASQDAEEQMQAALAELETLRTLDGANPDYKHVQARIYRSLALVLFYQDQRQDAQIAFNASLGLLKQLVVDFPYRAIYSYDLVLTTGMLPTRQTPADKLAERESQFRRSVTLSTQLTERYPQVPEYRTALANSHGKLGRFLETQDQLAQALEHLQQAFDIQQQLLTEFPEIIKFYFASAVAAQQLANMLAQSGDLAQARLTLQTAVENQSLFLKNKPNSTMSKWYLSQHYRSLAEVFALQGHSKLAAQAETQSSQIRDAWLRERSPSQDRNRTSRRNRSGGARTSTARPES